MPEIKTERCGVICSADCMSNRLMMGKVTRIVEEWVLNFQSDGKKIKRADVFLHTIGEEGVVGVYENGVFNTSIVDFFPFRNKGDVIVRLNNIVYENV